ncbi:MAG: (Fe-S)-binding protein [Promethearchaeota archaeon]
MGGFKKYKWLISTMLKAPWPLKKALVKGFRSKKKKYYPPNYDKKKGIPHANMKNIIYCMLCPNMCRFECPAVNVTKNEKHAPAGKARIAYYLEMGRLPGTPENVTPLFEGCVHCDACRVWCPFDFSVGDFLEGVAADLHEQGALPAPVSEFATRVRDNSGLYPADKYAASVKTIKREMKLGEVYYFPGCTTMAHSPGVVAAMAKIAEKSGEHLVADPDARVCCGAPSVLAGDLDTARELAKKNAEYINELGVNAVVCECPECTYALREQYKALGVELDAPVVHATEWIAKLLDEGKIDVEPVDESSGEVASYHDPCVLARKLKVTEAPRAILDRLFPETFRESFYKGDETHCCGYGGLVNVVDPEVAAKMSRKRLAEFDKVGARTITTCCPTCELSFQKHDEDLKFDVKNLVEHGAGQLK